jgi:hypothetical protein
MIFQGHTPFYDVYYHFECVTVAQFARHAAPDGTIRSSLTLNSELSDLHKDIIEEAVYAAAVVSNPAVDTATWVVKRRKAAIRRRRREAKRRSTRELSSEREMEVDELEPVEEMEESEASGTEYNPKK